MGLAAIKNHSAQVTLPDGWCESPLEEYVDILDHLRVPVNSSERSQRQGVIPYYGATRQIGWIDDFLFNEELLLLGEDGAPFLDKSKPIAYIISGKTWVNNHAHVLRAILGLTTNKYLKLFLDWTDFTDFVSGSTRLKLNQGSMRRIPVRLPPLAEQKRIVAKVEELLAHVSRAREHLDKVPAILKRLRQAVLAAACSGRLTADWRERNLQEPRDGDQEGPYDFLPRLPDSWEYQPLEGLLSTKEYGTSNRSAKDGKVPVLRMGNIQEGEIEWDDLKFTDDKNDIKRYSLRDGDLLFNRTNSAELVGKTAIYRGERPAIFAGYLIRLRTGDQLNPEFLNYYLNSSSAKSIAEMVRSDAVNQSNINGTKLGHYPVPLCSPEEQQEVVRVAGTALRIIDSVENQLRSSSASTKRLVQSILVKAFRGELVPTEAELARQEGRDYEPASVLLDRIRTERQAAAPKKKTKRRGKR